MKRKNKENHLFVVANLIQCKINFLKMKKNNLFNHFNILFIIFFICALNNFVISINFDFNERPQNQSILLGGRAILKCAVPPSNTKFDSQCQWRTNTGALLGFHDSGPLPGYENRYIYMKDGPGELHLQIENVSLLDDGKFECQMLRPQNNFNKFLRSSVFINVLGFIFFYFYFKFYCFSTSN